MFEVFFSGLGYYYKINLVLRSIFFVLRSKYYKKNTSDFVLFGALITLHKTHHVILRILFYIYGIVSKNIHAHIQ